MTGADCRLIEISREICIFVYVKRQFCFVNKIKQIKE